MLYSGLMMWIERTSLLPLTSPRRGAWLNLVAASTILLISTLFPIPSHAAVQTWTRWEQSLTSAKAYANPTADVTLKVTYRGPEEETITGLGFWDGSNTFKLRCLFPKAGRWTWQTTCSDTNNSSLHRQSGSVEVQPYPGANPLYKHGYLRVATNHRHLTHADGTPFLWIGDTAWAAPMNATMEDWQTYVRDRASKKFTVLQVFPASDWAGTNDWQGNAPFVGEGLTRINPAYWQQYERKVQFANEQGLVVAIVGLMEPVKRYPDAPFAQQFSRQLVARLMGNFVVFSPSFDSPYKELGDAVGQTVRESSSIHLITQHPGTDLPAAQTYHPKPYLDICGLQSGAGWGGNPLSAETVAKTAVGWSLELYRCQPPKPVINLEARYDSEFNEKQLARLPRSCGYWSLLSGCVGYTYGCAGIWNWGLKDTQGDPQGSLWDWRKGMNRTSSTEMKHMAAFFGGLKWWTLEPHPELILNQSDDWTKHMVLATSPKNELVVAYLPDNDAIRLGLAGFPASLTAQWFNPKTGEAQACPTPGKATEPVTLSRPAGWEDVLLVLRSGEH